MFKYVGPEVESDLSEEEEEELGRDPYPVIGRVYKLEMTDQDLVSIEYFAWGINGEENAGHFFYDNNPAGNAQFAREWEEVK